MTKYTMIAGASLLATTACISSMLMQSTQETPNIAECDHATGTEFVSPVDIKSDCWDEGDLAVMIYGTAPDAGVDKIDVVVRPRAAVRKNAKTFVASMSGWTSPATCKLQLTETSTGTTCEGETNHGATQLACKNLQGHTCSLDLHIAPQWFKTQPPFNKHVAVYQDELFPTH